MTIRRFSVALLVVCGLGGFSVDVAHADATAPAVPAGPNAADVTAAHTAATGSLPTLGRFFAADGQKPHGTTQQQAAEAAATVPRIDGATVPVYYLNPAFVADTSASGTSTPMAQFAFMATDAVSSSGAHASVWTGRVGGTWKVINIASGSDETTFTAEATPGATVFEEPQIGAWYQIQGGNVLPLNDTARASVGSHGVSAAAYHQLVRSRYADKLPGTAYDHTGYAGGFSAQKTPAAGGSADVMATSEAVGAGLALCGIVGVGYRRRKRTRV